MRKQNMPFSIIETDLEEDIVRGAADVSQQSTGLETVEDIDQFTNTLTVLLQKAGALKEIRARKECASMMVAANAG